MSTTKQKRAASKNIKKAQAAREQRSHRIRIRCSDVALRRVRDPG